MALNKQSIPVNFALGLDTKTDSKQVQLGNFLTLVNSVFDVNKQLTKRDGYPILTSLPDTNQTTLTTLQDNLLATGSNLYAFSADINQWLNKGITQPVQLRTQALIRNSTAQTSPDSVTAPNGLTCLVYMDSGAAYYQVSDSETGQQVVARTQLPATTTSPRAFILGRYFIITFIATVSGSPRLRYIAIPTGMPASPLAAADISTTVRALTSGYDGYVASDKLYIAWEQTATQVRIGSLNPSLIVSTPIALAGSHRADLMSVYAEINTTTDLVWVSFWDTTSNNGYTAAFNSLLAPVLAPTQIITGEELTEITSVSSNGLLTVIYEIDNDYTFAPNNRTDYLERLTVTSAGTVSAPAVILRSVGLGSKAFVATDGTIYTLAAYGEINQPTYFLIDSNGNIIMRLAYSNGGGYAATQVLPSISIINDVYYAAYMIKSFLAPVNKGTNLPSGTPVNGIYTQTGINLAIFTINEEKQYSSEIADSLHLTGGQLWQYDGVKPVEHGFHVYPENIAITTAGVGGLITAGTYNYQFTYEWTDNAGNLHRSAPSIPVTIVTTGATSANTINVPTARLTYKIAPNPIRIVGYRWSVAQQVYYQFTSITAPVVNDTTVDSVTIVDTLADSAILGQTLLYTTGGVIENIAAPSSIDTALFKNRLFLIDSENRNLLWYSKEVIQNTPIEMSDLLTLFVAPTSGAQGPTGPMTALGAMDDKLIVFKANAAYYITGRGPDNTGANNDFSDAIYITSSVGCTNPNSIVLMQNGIMFQSDKGIYLLGRDLSTNYIGAPVEQYNDNIVKSAQVIPGTTQVRFVLDNNITLMYDYYYNQWGTFSNVFAISSTLYRGRDTYLNSYGKVFQQTPGTYLDGSAPVLMSFTTSWINLAGVQGLERFYEMDLLGTYFSPFKLNVQLAYDYNPSATQATLMVPDNQSLPYGGEAQYGSGIYGGPGNVLQQRLFPDRQKCESFQITVNEIYDASFNQAAGKGVALSGLNLLVGMKRGYRTSKASQSFG